MGKKRLLYVSTAAPAPTGGGTATRAANHIKVLSELFDVTLAIVAIMGARPKPMSVLRPMSEGLAFRSWSSVGGRR